MTIERKPSPEDRELRPGQLQTYTSNGYCISTVNTMFSGWETLVFPAHYPTLEIKDFGEVDGERHDDNAEEHHERWVREVMTWEEGRPGLG